MINLEVFVQSTLRKILVHPDNYSSLRGAENSNHMESAVALIFKLPDRSQPIIHSNCPYQQLNFKIQYFLDTKLLLLQRGNKSAAYSGDVCLPGGKRQATESIDDAVFREVRQETGIKLAKSELLGMINKKFLAFQVQELSLITYAFGFLTKSQENLQLNTDQLRNYKWVTLRHFLSPSIYTYQPAKGVLKPLGITFKNYQDAYISFPAIEVGLAKGVYGLTLYILSYIVKQLSFKLLMVYTRMVQSQQRVNKYKVNIYSEVKEKVQDCLKGCIKLKNQYYRLWEVMSPRPLPQGKKQQLDKGLLKLFEVYYRQKPRL